MRKKAPGAVATPEAPSGDSENLDAKGNRDAEQSAVESSPWVQLFTLDRGNVKNEEIQVVINRDIASVLSQHAIAAQYNVRFLYDTRSMGRSDTDRIYRSLRSVDRKKPILLVVRSLGGSISAAFFIAKVCRESTDAGFVVVVPREAKSAATLVCCGADQIHMGSLSELGPIDPQFGAIPALALKHSIEHLAELAAQHPAAGTMLTEYLAKTLRIEALGYYERVAASAAQYAVRLLNLRTAKHAGEQASAPNCKPVSLFLQRPRFRRRLARSSRDFWR